MNQKTGKGLSAYKQITIVFLSYFNFLDDTLVATCSLVLNTGMYCPTNSHIPAYNWHIPSTHVP